ncbi:universal stress protein [Cupriavidus plantarum]|uniref:universal stress protein n=1 Tax=Cupriavidus plantarum TaxID=942865 RepID=UPI000E244E2C|nr:universal stress protein [Cupriavidus plantarum]NYH98573.1 nucleotide-binding universal stress UspA family protein [Cupriavidus plantarum]REF01497.1 nucleotide-binding universal stress UspA family protein [Cupriavidus plantarum]RLK45640.1 nucleotide-binding universal stress UspA family protein [Cupriavidus plantarum]
MQNIILATDGSVHSDAAARSVASRTLLRGDFAVHVVHCMPELSGEIKRLVGRETIADWMADEGERNMRSAVTILRDADFKVECHVLVGFAPDRIVALAKELQAAAIVLGTHGRGAFLDAVIGSVATRVLAHAPCPVLLVKGSAAI